MFKKLYINILIFIVAAILLELIAYVSFNIFTWKNYNYLVPYKFNIISYGKYYKNNIANREITPPERKVEIKNHGFCGWAALLRMGAVFL